MQTVYPKARTKFLKGQIDWEGDAFTAMAVDATFTYSELDEFSGDLTGILGDAALTGMAALDNGWADANDVTITGMTPGDVVRGFVIARNVGSPSTDDLVWVATSHADTIPINRIVDGSGSMTFSFANTPGRIFQLGS